MIKTILFDFDGTLFDTGEGILRSVQYALEGFGIHETDTARLRKFVGPPLLDSFSELYAMTPEQAQAAVARYRERYLPNVTVSSTVLPAKAFGKIFDTGAPATWSITSDGSLPR